MRKTLTAALLLAAATVHAQNKEQLRLNLEKGKTYRQYTHADMETQQVVNNETSGTQTIMAGLTTFHVADYKDGVYELEASIEELVLETKFGDSVLFFANTADTLTSNVMDKLMSNMIGRKYTVLLHHTGEVKSVSNVDNIYVNIFKGLPPLSQEQRVALMTEVHKSWGEDALKANLASTFVRFADKKVGPGDEWHTQIPMKTPMEGMVDFTYKLVEKTPNAVLLTAKGKQTTTASNRSLKISGFYARYDLNGDMSTTIKLDPVSGWIQERISQQQIKGNMYMRENEELTDELKVPMSISTRAIVSDKKEINKGL